MGKKKIAIVGSGPAALAAAIYTSRAEIETTIYAGEEPGGQLTKTTEIENFPGVMGKTGPELMLLMQAQAEKFGAKLVFEVVEQIWQKKEGQKEGEEEEPKFVVRRTAGQSEYDALIIATGASSRMLQIGEEKYFGRGLSTCAVCDAAFYRDKVTYVVGGGDSAVEDALALTKFAREVHLLVRGEALRASKAMQKKLFQSPVAIHYRTSVVAVLGESRLEKLVLSDGREVLADGLFLAIGHDPATKFLAGSGVVLDEKGYVKTGLVVGNVSWLFDFPTMTSLPGVFAAGDCVDFRYRQAAVASGMGVMAALDAEKWLERK